MESRAAQRISALALIRIKHFVSPAPALPDVRRQSCKVHFYRNVFSHVPSPKVREVSHMLKTIHAQESREAALEKTYAVLVVRRRQRLVRAAEMVGESIGETLAYYAHSRTLTDASYVPEIRWSGSMNETRLRSHVVGAFPNGQSCLNLPLPRLRHFAADRWATQRFMDMKPLFEEKLTTKEPSPEK